MIRLKWEVIVTFDEWLAFGLSQGWISEPVCAMHDGVPGTEVEEDEWEQGYEPCQPILRLWNDQIVDNASGSLPVKPLSGLSDMPSTPTS